MMAVEKGDLEITKILIDNKVQLIITIVKINI
jgi:hypothetical protein